jgi:membrane dipeptidase
MTPLAYRDHRRDPRAWADALGISREAIDLYLDSEIFDWHVDTFIWTRIFGYDLTARHGSGPFGARFFGQVDLPRIREAAIGSACWVITTNPAKVASERRQAFFENLARLESIFASVPTDVARVRSAGEWRAARAAGKHAAFVGIQGGNALDDDLSAIDALPDGAILRITLVHLSSSRLGATSSPLARGAGARGLSPFGKDYVRRLNDKKIFVDLAHISPEGFWDALAVHDPAIPAIVTHTGVSGVHRHWRNLDDDQIRAIADRGGIVGVMFHGEFLDGKPLGGSLDALVAHLEHVRDVGGEAVPCLGSDWDGAISTPREMPTCLELPRLVDRMLRRGWNERAIRAVLGGNALRVIETLRP